MGDLFPPASRSAAGLVPGRRGLHHAEITHMSLHINPDVMTLWTAEQALLNDGVSLSSEAAPDLLCSWRECDR